MERITQRLKDNKDLTSKTIKTATVGLAMGSIYGASVANSYPNPSLVRSTKACGTHGLSFAALGVIHVNVEQFMFEKRKKDDIVNSAVGAFVAGSIFFGFKGKSVFKGVGYGAALAATCAGLDYCFKPTGV